ncbi:MAG: pyrroline-5-carboxylate reductase [Gemmatimonadales bacterium]|nr:MAG: pyrroline-5-carboxylate reductase [Gemmatimonadales bacterium]
MTQAHSDSVAILGVGNLGLALARGLVHSGYVPADHVRLTRRNVDLLAQEAAAGHPVGSDNPAAVEASEIIVLAVQPQQLDDLLDEIREALDPTRHLIISTVSGASFDSIRNRVGEGVPVVRAMPNLGIQTGDSMTCLAAEGTAAGVALARAERLFQALGTTVRIEESQMAAATALCACGIAFFLRAIRAAAQGGIEIGFHAEDAILMAAQTAKGAAELLLASGDHPEMAIDRVTTPNGCTIAGLNEMENRGFSSAMIRGIVTSSVRAAHLYSEPDA